MQGFGAWKEKDIYMIWEELSKKSYNSEFELETLLQIYEIFYI